MKVPEQTHSGQLNRSKIVAQPSAGATRPAHKSCEPDANLKYDGKASEVVTEAKCTEGVTYAAMYEQQGSNLPANVWKNRK